MNIDVVSDIVLVLCNCVFCYLFVLILVFFEFWEFGGFLFREIESEENSIYRLWVGCRNIEECDNGIGDYGFLRFVIFNCKY